MKTQLLRQTKKSLQLNDMKQLCSQNLRVRNLNKADTGGMAGRCSLMASDECLKAQGCLSHLKVCSPTCWVVDACSLLEMRPLLGWPGILLTAWGLGSPGEHPGRERPMWKPYCFAWFSSGSHTSKCLLWSQLQRPAWVPGSLNTTGNILEPVWDWKYDFGNFWKTQSVTMN